jgi:hypothetical protein
MKIEERDECIMGLVKKINQIEQNVNNLSNRQKKAQQSQSGNHSWSTSTNIIGFSQRQINLVDRHTQSVSPNRGETTTSGNGDSQVPKIKIPEEIEDIESIKSISPKL